MTFCQAETDVAGDGGPVAFEAAMKLVLSPLDFTIAGRADRIDRNSRGALRIVDYKTGTPPTESQQAKFDKQLLIEAAMAEQGGIEGFDPITRGRGGLYRHGRHLQRGRAPLTKEPPDKVLAELKELISSYLEPDQGFTSRRMLHKDTDIGDYDHLARFGEWDRTAETHPEDLT